MELKINNSYVNLEENVRGMRTKSANNHSLIPTTFFIIIAHCVLKSIYYLLLFAELCAFHCSLEAEFQLSFVLIITSGMFFLSLSFHALVHIGIHCKQTHTFKTSTFCLQVIPRYFTVHPVLHIKMTQSGE